MNTWKRRALAVIAVALLSVPSAFGVYHALVPTRGAFAAAMAAAGFEAVYISTALLMLRPALRSYARNVSLAAVIVAVILNTLADYQARVPGGLARWTVAVEQFDPLALALALIESAPLAALAYAMATLLHRLSEDESDAAHVLSSLLAPESPATITKSITLSETHHAEPPALTDDAPALSKTARVKALATERGVSISTAWRWVNEGKVEL